MDHVKSLEERDAEHTDSVGQAGTRRPDAPEAPLAPGDSIFANIEYWPLDRYSSGRGTARGDGTFRKATAKEGQLRWSVCSDDMTTTCGVDEDCPATGATCVADPLGGRGRPAGTAGPPGAGAARPPPGRPASPPRLCRGRAAGA